MKYQYLPNTEASNSDIIIQRISYAGGVSAESGTQNAPNAILKASNQIEYYDEDLDWSPMKYLNIFVSNNVSKYNKIQSSTKKLNIKEPEATKFRILKSEVFHF